MKNVKRDQSRITFSLKFGCEVARLKVSVRLWWRYFCQEQIFLFPAFQLERQLSYMSTLHRKAHAPLRRPYQIRLPSHKKTVISTRFLQRSEQKFRRWIVTYRIGFCAALWRFLKKCSYQIASCEHEKQKLACAQTQTALN